MKEFIDLRAISAAVAEATDEQLEAGFEANREPILEEIFRQMPAALRAERAEGLDAVVEWQITGRPDGGHDRFQVVIRSGACRVVRDGSETPTVSYRIDPVDFLRLVTGNASGPRLFIFGRLRIRGDIVLAARVPALFRIPGPEAEADAH